MASLWLHLYDKDIYVPFESFEQAYFLASSLFKTPSYLSCIEYSMTKSVIFLGADKGLQLYIYYGTGLPPLKEEWYPNGIFKITKQELIENDDFIKRKEKIIF